MTTGIWWLLGVVGYCLVTWAILKFNDNAALKKEDDHDRRMR